jgi:putative transposase
MRFRFIDAERAGLAVPISRLCKLLQVSVSGYYAWRKRGPSQRQLDDMVLLAHVRAAYRGSRETYGAERVHHELVENGVEIGRHRVARLMRDNDLSPKRKQKFKKTTDSKHNKAVTSNLLDQDFSAQAPNEKWAGDISYIWTAQGWLYLAVILDLFSRRVVGWAAGPRMTSDLPLRALNRAIALRRPSPGAIHHSDRGSQYCSDVYQARLGELGFLVSMSGKGNCYDNAAVETFFKTIKSELIWRTVFMSRNQAEIAIAGYIDGFYNPVRRHSTLGFISPVKFETNALQPA